MKLFTMRHFCTICGQEKLRSHGWFLLAENRWEDKLRILRWDDRLATCIHLQEVCSAAHARELVVHWMSTGSLRYPFALTRSFEQPSELRPSPEVWSNSDARQLGELCVDRGNIRRVLSENPTSLTIILDELTLALRPHGAWPESIQPAIAARRSAI